MGTGRRDPREEVKKRREATRRLFDQTGGVALLCEMPMFGEKGFDELVELVPASRSTVSSRLDDAQDAGFIEPTYVDSEFGTKKVYKFTNSGHTLRTKLQTRGIVRLYQKVRTLEEELEEDIDNFRSWAVEAHSIHPPEDRERYPGRP